MRRTLIALFAILAGLWVADRLGGLALWQLHRHSDGITAHKLRYISEQASEDVVLFGTSRCESHYDARLLADSLGMSVYNAGLDGSHNIFAHYAMLSLLLEHHCPKVVVLECSPNDYVPYEGSSDVLSSFAPYMGRVAAIDTMLSATGQAWRYRLSHLYRYNARSTSDLAGFFVSYADASLQGFSPLRGRADTLTSADFLPGHDSLLFLQRDEVKVRYFEQFIAQCQQHGIRLVLAASPKLEHTTPLAYQFFRDEARLHGLPFFDYHSTGLFADRPGLFYDAEHLQAEGARLYTLRFLSDFQHSQYAQSSCY